jgi:hypothetical protein
LNFSEIRNFEKFTKYVCSDKTIPQMFLHLIDPIIIFIQLIKCFIILQKIVVNPDK